MSSNIPKLRFPEFEGEWDEKPLSKMGEVIGGGTPSSSNISYWNGNIPWISSSDIDENNIHKINISRFITNEAIINSATKLCLSPSILLVSRVGVGKVALSTIDICTSQDFTNICNVNENETFVAHLLSVIMKRKAVETQGTSIKGIPSTEIKNYILCLPHIGEQQKIADFLSAVDSRIEGLVIMMDLQKKYKQGVMQRIFNQTIRFKDNNGNPFPDWQETKLSTLCLNISSGKNKLRSNTGIYPVYGSMGLLGYSDTKAYNNPSIIIARVGANAGEVNKVDGDYDVSDNALVLFPNNNYLLAFAYYQLTYLNLNKLTFGSGQPLVTAGQLNKLDIILPHTDEQRKIADFLRALDAKIEATQKQLDAAREWKKGLLQKMFV